MICAVADEMSPNAMCPNAMSPNAMSPNAMSRVIRSPLAGGQDGSTLSANSRHPRSGVRPSYLEAARGLRMTRESSSEGSGDFAHLPVMVDEVVELLASTPGGVVLDATVGGGGHAAAVLAASTSHRLVGLEQVVDEPALQEAHGADRQLWTHRLESTPDPLDFK